MTALALPLLWNCLRRAIKHRSIIFLLHRYGCSLPTDMNGRVCIQCTGAGEIRGAAALISRLEALGHSAFVGLLHPTEWDMAGKNLPNIPRVYLPVDHGFATRRWLRRIVPSAIIVVEAELWPNFLATANSSNPPIPTALVNARLSSRMTNAPRLARKTVFNIFRQIRCVLTRQERDVKKFISLGARANTVKALGNLKYSAVVGAKASFSCPSGRLPYVLAVSTHEGEEKTILDAWVAISIKPLLVFIPRNPKRVPALIKTFDAKGLNIGLHSRDLVPNQDTSVYFVDTLGETLPWIQHAEFVFVGGSLSPQYGGQNVLEPAALSRACIVGPYTKTFRDEINALLDTGGIIRVTDKASLQATFSGLLSDPEDASRIGTRAHAHVKSKSKISNQYIEALQHYGVLPSNAD